MNFESKKQGISDADIRKSRELAWSNWFMFGGKMPPIVSHYIKERIELIDKHELSALINNKEFKYDNSNK